MDYKVGNLMWAGVHDDCALLAYMAPEILSLKRLMDIDGKSGMNDLVDV